MNATKPQLVALQALYAKYARHSLDAGSDRGARLAWASETLGRTVDSFAALTSIEASALIDALQRSLGRQPNRGRRMDRRRAKAAGTHGRRGVVRDAEELATTRDLERIQSAVAELGWTQERLDAFLRSSSSPLRGRSNPQVRTVADANKVYWALKGIAKRQGNR